MSISRYFCRGIREPIKALSSINALGATPAQIALAWLLAQKQWIVPISGTTKISRMEENLGAIDVRLTETDLKRMQDATSKLSLDGARLPEAMLKMTGR